MLNAALARGAPAVDSPSSQSWRNGAQTSSATSSAATTGDHSSHRLGTTAMVLLWTGRNRVLDGEGRVERFRAKSPKR